MEFFPIEMHYGGLFVYLPKKAYVNGVIKHLFFVKEIVEKARYSSYKEMHYLLPGGCVHNDLRLIRNERHAMAMANIRIEHGVVEMNVIANTKICVGSHKKNKQ